MKPEDAQGSADRDRLQPATGWVEAAAILLALYFGYQLALVAWGLVRGLLVVVLLVVFGSLLAYLLMPAIDWLERRGAPRVLGILSVYLLGLSALALAIALLAGPLSQQGAAVVGQIPAYLDQARQWLEGVDTALARRGFRVNLASAFASRAAALAGSGGVEQIVAAAFTWARTAVQSVVYLVMVLVTAFWIAKDGRLFRDRFVQALPVPYRERALFLLEASGVVVGGYLRAQLLLALIIGVVAAAGTWLLGVHYPLVIGLAAAVFELIPMIGPVAGGAIAVTIALFQSPRLALLTAAWFLFIHLVEGYSLAPRVTGRFVRLHPLVAFLALFTGAQVGGFLGALFAVPLASLANLLITDAYRAYQARRPEMFAATPPLEPRGRLALRPFRKRADEGPTPPLSALVPPRPRWWLVAGLTLLAFLALATLWLFLR